MTANKPAEPSAGKFPPRVWVSIPGASTWMEKPAPEKDGFPDAVEYVSIDEFDSVRFERDAFLEGDSEWEHEAKTAKAELQQRDARIVKLENALKELVDLMEDVRSGEYAPDSFTCQPARTALESASGEGGGA